MIRTKVCVDIFGHIKGNTDSFNEVHHAHQPELVSKFSNLIEQGKKEKTQGGKGK